MTNSNMHFENRQDAAMQLLPHLEKYRNKEGVVLAVPRGGVPMGYYISKELQLPLDLMMTKKIGHPVNSEYAIGAVSLEENYLEDRTGVPPDYIEKEIPRIRQQLKERYRYFMGEKKPVDLKNKIVIVVDDGIATGRTMIASIKMLRRKHPKKIVIAVPVSPVESAEKIKKLVDELICLHTPEEFYGVGMFYEDFSEVTDEEVISILKELNETGKAA
jgi:putative phosphoribosyl transferase